MPEIKLRAAPDGVYVLFSFDKDVVTRIKAAFPKARWNPAEKCWYVPGQRAEGRVRAWLDELPPEAKAPFDLVAARKELADNPLPSKYAKPRSTVVAIVAPYQPKIVSLLRNIHARWNREDKAWVLTYEQVPALRGIIDQINELGAAAEAAEAQARQLRAAEQQQAREEKAAERVATFAKRFLVLLNNAPPIGRAMRRNGGDVVVIESFGKSFRVSEDMPSILGSFLLGHEGEACCYAYFRPATEAERADLEASEAAQKQRQEAVKEAKNSLNKISDKAMRQGDIPPRQDYPVNTTVLLTVRPELAIYGGGDTWLTTTDALWLVRGNGADGDDFSRNNLPGAIGYRLPRDQVIEDELRRIAGVLEPAPPALPRKSVSPGVGG